MSTQESSASKIGRLSEIISIILFELEYAWTQEEDRTIFACSLVNSQWNSEAIRWIWASCTWWPVIDHISQIEPHRRQRYANHIRRLDITISDIIEREKVDYQDLLSQLASLSFPCLDELQITSPHHYISNDWQGPPLIQFARPSLKTLYMTCFNRQPEIVVNDEFLLELSKHSTKLEILDCSPYCPRSNISPEILTELLGKLPLLCLFNWQMESAMSLEAFRILACKSELIVLLLVVIHDHWIDDLVKWAVPERPIFPSLGSLQCRTSSRALRALLTFLPQLTSLTVEANAGSIGMFKTIADSRHNNLTELSFSACEGSIIEFEDLLKLVKNNAALETLNLGSHDNDAEGESVDPLPELRNINQDTIGEVLRHMPDLETLTLLTIGYHFDEGILSLLGTHCPKLTDCTVTAKIDWIKLVRDNPVNAWPALTQLTADAGGSDDDELSLMEDEETVAMTAEAIVQRMPSLFCLMIFEENLQKAVYDALRARRNGWASP